MTRPDRLRGIVQALQTQRWHRAIDLAERFDVSLRTIYRDMNALDDAGIPIVAVPGKGYRLDEDYVLPPIMFTIDEAAVLLLGTDYLADHVDANYQAAARSASEKVTAALPEDQRETVARLKAGLRFVPINAFENPAEAAHLPDLRRAIDAHRTVRFTYHEHGTASDAAPCTVNPYGLINRGGAWYLVGYDQTHEHVRSFRLTWITSATVLETHFERPAGYRGALGAPAPVTVQVLFDPDVARWVREAPSFYTTEMTPHPDGLLVTLKVAYEGEVIPWLLSWGVHARVLEPASLQRRLAREAARIIAQYRAELTLL